MEAVIKSAGSALLAYTAHYCATKLYNYGCVPDGIWGYLGGMITTGSPICQAGVQIISHTQVSYSSMIMMGITRVIIDVIAPGASVVK
jgi:hypothetical protein